MSRRAPKKTAFVPRIVFTVAVASVVPQLGCGDSTGGGGQLSVAQGGFGGVAAGGFGGVAAGGFGGVAAGGFGEGGEGGEAGGFFVAEGGFGGVAAGGFGEGGTAWVADPPASDLDAPGVGAPWSKPTAKATRVKVAARTAPARRRRA